MSPSDDPRPLPANPSREHLRKRAKRLARTEGLQLAAAQRRLAVEHGFPTWAALMKAVDESRPRSPLFTAAAAADVEAVRRLLATGTPVDGTEQDPGTPLWAVCDAVADEAARREIAGLLVQAGAFLHSDRPGETALHAAARRGPLALVDDLIGAGALEWRLDRRHRTPVAVARLGEAADRDAIVHLLQRPVIDDPAFRSAVAAIHAGDAATLARLLDADLRLLRERIREPECYRRAGRFQYFLDPALFWFVADNPDLVRPMPPGMVDCARVMIERGVEAADLDYALELAMTSDPAMRAGLLGELMAVLLAAGARATPKAVEMALAHGLATPVEALLAGGHPMTAPIAASLGRLEDLAHGLPDLSPDTRQAAFGLAVINGRHEAARMLLEAGADVDGFLPVHAHSTALHHAANTGDMRMLELLAAFGARDDIADRMWNSTALGWARHGGHQATAAWLEALAARRRGA